uniref:Uncharacterized protein LOC113792547 n=1 Tax=Dermatophagoides pteronyssinus TaxID=6956 RepID=A0A6P6XY56_DERPT|nr:uncharacterized protein LOC113792547 [Dermatophagoides pteronyssinus]
MISKDGAEKLICPRLNKSKNNDNDDKKINSQSSSSSSSSKLESRIKTRTRSKKNQQNHKIQRPCRAAAAAASSSATTTVHDGCRSHRNSKQNSLRRKNPDEDNRSNVSCNKTNSRERSIKRKTNGRFRIPLRSRSMFIKIRQKGRNFGIRCKTSVELWRKWIKRGIGWGSNDNNDLIDRSMTESPSRQMLNETMPSQMINKKPVTMMIRKNIITDVIPEEDEQQDEKIDDNNSEIHRQQSRNQTIDSQSSVKIEIEINDINDDNNDGQQQQQLTTTIDAVNFFQHDAGFLSVERIQLV